MADFWALSADLQIFVQRKGTGEALALSNDMLHVWIGPSVEAVGASKFVFTNTWVSNDSL